MDSLTKGFCADAINSRFPNRLSGNAWESLWPSPKVQVVDIQRYPMVVLQRSVVSRFYLAVSDSASLIWLVVPPGGELEEVIHTFQLEVGCLISLDKYTVITAKNGLNVVVPLSISYLETHISLLGNPVVDQALFSLSKKALTNRRCVANPGFLGAMGGHRKLSLADVVEARGRGLGNYSLDLRIVWKGKQRQLSENNSVKRFVFDCIGVDERGDAISILCIGGSALGETILLGDCVCAMNGSLTYRNDAEESVRLILDERSSVVLRIMTESTTSNAVTALPCRMFGARSVTNVVNSTSVGDIVSVEGIVVSVLSASLVNTRRGRVERSKFVLRDHTFFSSTAPHSSSFFSSSGSSILYLIDVTLWGDFARSVEPRVGERWCLCGFIVGEFMRRLTLSTRSGCSLFKMQLEEVLHAPQTDINTNTVRMDGSDAPMVVLGLHEASETAPVLAKVQRVRLPLTYTVCGNCGKNVRGRGKTFFCTACGSTVTEERFLVRLELSDGLSVISAVGFASVAETLFCVGPQYLLKQLEESPAFGHAIARELVGLPLLFWLLRSHSSGGEGNEDGLVHIVRCEHIGMARCASMLLEAVVQMNQFCGDGEH